MKAEKRPELPPEFWESLLWVRNFLQQDPVFDYIMFGSPNRGNELRRAFDVLDCWLKEYIERCGF